MGIQADWVRWCHHSLVKHFHDALSSTADVYVEGRQRQTDEPLPRFEVRVDGPYFNEPSKDLWLIDVEINILITSSRDLADVYAHQRLIGEVTAAFTCDIPVYKYGPDTEAKDDGTLLGCFIEKTNNKDHIIVSNFGLVDPAKPLIMSTVEGQYQMCLKEG